MKLNVSKRSKEKKEELTSIRVEGDIPAVLYQKGGEGIPIRIKGDEFAAHMRKIAMGYLSTTVFEFELDGKNHRVLVKEIQYHKTTYKTLHIDFMELVEDRPITVNVPLNFKGLEACAGIKLGGFLRMVRRHLKVRCLPKDLPTEVSVDVSGLALNQSRRVKDLPIAAGVRCLFPMNEAVAVISKR